MKYSDIKKKIIIFILVVLGCTIFKIIAFALPTSIVKSNVEKSRITIQNTGDYPAVAELNGDGDWSDAAWNQSDFFTEWLLVNTVYNVDSKHPVQSAMLNTRVFTDTSSPANSLLLNIDASEYSEYDLVENPIQYWFGGAAFLRVCLTFGDYSQTLTFVQIIAIITMVGSILAIYKRTMDFKVWFSYVLALLMVSVVTVTYSFNFSITFIISFVAIIYICQTQRELSALEMPFLVIGMLTAYCDWLSTPSITCTLPLAIAIVVCETTEEGSSGKDLLTVIKIGISWCIGYLGMICSKWVISGILTQENIVLIVKQRILSDVGVEIDNKFGYYLEILKRYFNMLLTNKLNVNWLWVGVGVVVIFYLFFTLHDEKKLLRNIEISIIALVPFVWAIVFLWHCHEHFWFTYRNLVVTIFVAFLMMMRGIEETVGRYKNHLGNMKK